MYINKVLQSIISKMMRKYQINSCNFIHIQNQIIDNYIYSLDQFPILKRQILFFHPWM